MALYSVRRLFAMAIVFLDVVVGVALADTFPHFAYARGKVTLESVVYEGVRKDIPRSYPEGVLVARLGDRENCINNC